MDRQQRLANYLVMGIAFALSMAIAVALASLLGPPAIAVARFLGSL